MTDQPPRRPAPASSIARPVETVQPSLGLFDPQRDHIRMVMRDLVVEVAIGLHPWEQLRPQRLVVNVEAWAYVGQPYTQEDAGLILDYDAIRDVIREDWPKRDHMKLLEPMYELPGETGISEVVINREAAEKRAEPLYIYADRKKDATQRSS